MLKAEDSIDLVFSDVQLPGSMDGFSLAGWVKENCPDTKVILTSGVVQSEQLAEELCNFGPVERKPYRPERVLERIKLLLDKQSRS